MELHVKHNYQGQYHYKSHKIIIYLFISKSHYPESSSKRIYPWTWKAQEKVDIIIVGI